LSPPKGTDAEVMELVRRVGKTEAAKRLGVHIRNLNMRCRNLELKYQQQIIPPHPNATLESPFYKSTPPIRLDIKNGEVFIGSDAHIWPGPQTTAMRAFIKLIKERKPKAVIMNGDVMDFPRISRHPPIGWAKTPTVVEEIEAAIDQMHEVATAAGRARKVWPAGNHDLRFETKLHTFAPEYAEVRGFSLKNHFPLWEPCWACEINDDVVVKHRYKGGIHATHNNAIWSGKTMVTGHLHSLKVTPFTDYRGTRWGVDCGCLADADSRAFTDYTEQNPLNWRSGFCILTFQDGVLLPPELVMKWGEGKVTFRGQILKV
jgi:hypothetical protein